MLLNISVLSLGYNLKYKYLPKARPCLSNGNKTQNYHHYACVKTQRKRCLLVTIYSIKRNFSKLEIAFLTHLEA